MGLVRRPSGASGEDASKSCRQGQSRRCTSGKSPAPQARSCSTACWASYLLCLQPPPETGSGKFYFKNGATYEGEWMKVPLPKAEGAEVKPADVKAVAAAAASAADQPDTSQIMRHGKGCHKKTSHCSRYMQQCLQWPIISKLTVCSQVVSQCSL